MFMKGRLVPLVLSPGEVFKNLVNCHLYRYCHSVIGDIKGSIKIFFGNSKRKQKGTRIIAKVIELSFNKQFGFFTVVWMTYFA